MGYDEDEMIAKIKVAMDGEPTLTRRQVIAAVVGESLTQRIELTMQRQSDHGALSLFTQENIDLQTQSAIRDFFKNRAEKPIWKGEQSEARIGARLINLHQQVSALSPPPKEGMAIALILLMFLGVFLWVGSFMLMGAVGRQRMGFQDNELYIGFLVGLVLAVLSLIFLARESKLESRKQKKVARETDKIVLTAHGPLSHYVLTELALYEFRDVGPSLEWTRVDLKASVVCLDEAGESLTATSESATITVRYVDGFAALAGAVG